MCLLKNSTAKTALPADSASRLYAELGINQTISPSAFEKALKGYLESGQESPLLALIDYTKPSTEKRFCVVNLQEKRVLFETHVTHGKNSGDNYAVSFSNEPGSFKSSLGFFLTGKTYYGRNGYSLNLEGLERGINDNARERRIVIHGASYADPTRIVGQKRLGRSLGCPALPPDVSREIIDTIKNGVLLYIHGPSPEVSVPQPHHQRKPTITKRDKGTLTLAHFEGSSGKMEHRPILFGFSTFHFPHVKNEPE